jgi:dipeptidase E
MKTITTLFLTTILICTLSFSQSATKNADTTNRRLEKTIFIYGGMIDQVFIRYIIGLTYKPDPKICFIPTASADREAGINMWYEYCTNLPLRPSVLRTFINSSPEQKTFEEEILTSDAIIVGGGNTLNMIAIWKAQGIDTLLRKAYDKGIVLAGGSAGSLCWLAEGYSDSRPKYLSIIKGLGFLDFSHAPHYQNYERRSTFIKAITDGRLKPGYGCDNYAGLLFVNGILKKSVSQNTDNNNYFVSLIDGKVNEELLPAEIIK